MSEDAKAKSQEVNVLLNALAEKGALEKLDPETLERLSKLGDSARIVAIGRPKVQQALAYRSAPFEVALSQNSVIMRNQAEYLRVKYEEAVETQRTFQLLNIFRKPMPFDDVLKRLAGPKLEVALEWEDSFELILPVPGRSFEDLLRAINHHRDDKIRCNKDFQQHVKQKPKKKTAALVDKGLIHFNDLNLPLDRRNTTAEAYNLENGFLPMHRLTYGYLFMSSLRRNELIDQNSVTILNGDPALTSSSIPIAGEFGGPYFRGDFFSRSAGCGDPWAHYRRVVGDDIRKVL